MVFSNRGGTVSMGKFKDIKIVFIKICFCMSEKGRTIVFSYMNKNVFVFHIYIYIERERDIIHFHISIYIYIYI